MTVITPLATWLNESGVKVDDMADVVGMHRVSLYAAKAGRSMPRPANATKIEKFTGGAIGSAELLKGYNMFHDAQATGE